GDRRHAVRNVLPFLLLRSRAAGSSFRCSGSCHWFFSSRRAKPSLFLRGFLLAGDCALARTLARTRIGVRALAANRQTAAVTHSAVAVDLHQPLDVEAGVLAEIALDLSFVRDHLTNLANVILGKVFHPDVAIHGRLLKDVRRPRTADAEDIRQSDFDPLVEWQINTCNTCHWSRL